ncbi:uncharacterized protein PITG_15577 [Phytophthora infestans T30-4]|uniref:Uncharacterized protein n=1 Tax=Phytophthora infestans (strain T30-4) TaxID=403677 RepID=D0NT42_PHYIT|nr:uncharacterized protein PITG_15577 [Phytophthora infestans T30-4]EEY64798.1 hypothetical protein PITG_15577 [Phytophthora infestans T30-4]|eukprot:XP_002897725.1 hypothetical protein PITG_15577 [Phytophthora infestans T30-4]
MMVEVLELLASDSPCQDRSASTTASSTTNNNHDSSISGLNHSSTGDTNHGDSSEDNDTPSSGEDSGDQTGKRPSHAESWPSNDDNLEEKYPAGHRIQQEQEPLGVVQQMQNSMNAGMFAFYGGDLGLIPLAAAASAPIPPSYAAALIPPIPAQVEAPMASREPTVRRLPSPHKKPRASVATTKEEARQQKTRIQELQMELARFQELESQMTHYQQRSVESLEKELEIHRDEAADLSEKVKSATNEEQDWISAMNTQIRK